MVSKRRWLGWALLAMGLGIVAAPAIFQMFTRAPSGGEMINDFRPMMTTERLRDVQGYFVTLGAGEGQLRVGVEAAYTDGGGDMAEFPAGAVLRPVADDPR